jgi:hypothetical protein
MKESKGKPKKAKPKTNASQPSLKNTVGGAFEKRKT